MEEKSNASLEPTPEQILYASVLEKGMYLGLACLFVTFALYVSGIMQPYIPLEELPEHWSKNVHKYLTDAEIKAGWGWVPMLGHGDFVNFIGIVALAGVTIVCYVAIIPLLLKRRDMIYAILALLFMSFRAAVYALIPNALPVLFYFGTLGWSGITLNTTTGLVACLVLGIAVDDTIHFLARFNASAKQRADERVGVREALVTVGRPVTYTSVALCLGFLILTPGVHHKGVVN